MKGIKYILLAVLSLPFAACNFLETDPYDYLEQDDIYRTENDCNRTSADSNRKENIRLPAP